MKVGIPKAENQTTALAASSSSSSASPVSLGMQASRSRMESLPNSEHQTPGSFSSTGLLEKQQQGTGPVKSQALPIIWEEDYDFAKWETTSVWRELLQGHAIPNGEAALKALMPREVARALEDMAAVEVNVASTSREAIAAWFAAMETRLPQTPVASEFWQEIKKNSDFDNTFSFESSLWRTEGVLDAWREVSPVEFQACQEAVDEARKHNTVLETWTAAYSEIENLEKRVRDLRISPAVKVGSGWEADMNFMLLKAFNSLLETAKQKALREAKRAREMCFELFIISPQFFIQYQNFFFSLFHPCYDLKLLNFHLLGNFIFQLFIFNTIFIHCSSFHPTYIISQYLEKLTGATMLIGAKSCKHCIYFMVGNGNLNCG
jgi:hypothetical protein